MPAEIEKEASDPGQPAPEDLAPIQFETFCDRVMGDEKLAYDLVRKVTLRLQADLDEIEGSIRQNDLDQVSFLAHRMKSTFSNLAAVPMQQACKALEVSASKKDWSTLPDRFEMLRMRSIVFQRAAEEILRLQQS